MEEYSQSKDISAAYNEFYATTDWKENKLHTRLYVKSLLNLIRRLYKQKIFSVIDIGCGTGIYTYTFSRFVPTVCGIDFSEIAVKKAQEKYPEVNFECRDASYLILNKKYDLVFSKGFSLFNTTDFAQTCSILKSWNNSLSNNGVIVIQSRTDFSQKSPSNWYYHTEDEIETMFNIPDLNYKLAFVYGKFQFLFLLPFCERRVLNLINWFSKRMIKKLNKPVNYFVFLTKKENSL